MDEMGIVEAVEEKDGLLNKLKDIVKQVLRENRQKAAPQNSLTNKTICCCKAPVGHYVETSSCKRIGSKSQDSEDYPKAKVSEIEPISQSESP